MLGSATKLKTIRNIKLQGAVSGNADFDGSANITIDTTQANIVKLTGNLELAANTSDNAANGYCKFTEISIDYPVGFSRDNCIVIAYNRKTVRSSGYGWNNYPNSTDMYEGTLPLTIGLYGNDSSIASAYRNKIRIRAGNLSTQSQTITYEVVLMKIS